MASNTTDDGSKCPICFEIYKEPKALVCLHTFCETCIDEYILKSKEKGLLCDGIECPLCRFVTTVDKDQPPETWAKSLRSNFALASLLNSSSLNLKHSEQDEEMCQPCLKQNNTNSAVTFCTVCNERLCDECKTVHDRLEFTKYHQSIDIERRENVEFFTTFQTLQKCAQHGKKIKFYCRDEDKLCCSSCAIITHRECKRLVELSEIVNDKCHSAEGSILSKQISELENKMKMSSAHFVNESKNQALQAAELMDNFKQLRQQVSQRFDELEDKLKGEIKAIQPGKASEILVNAVGCDEIACEMQRLRHTLELAKQNGTNEQQFVVVKKLMNEFGRQQAQADLKFAEVESMTFSLKFSKAMEEFLNTSTEFASVLVDSKTEVLPNCAPKSLSIVAETDIIQGNEAYEPWYRGIGFLNDGRVAATDRRNNKCVLLDETLGKLGEIILMAEPLNLAVTENNCVIITTGKHKKIFLFVVNKDNTFTEKETLLVDKKCDSISVIDTNNCVVGTFADTEPAQKLTLAGNLTQLSFDFQGKQFLDTYSSSKCCYTEERKQLLITEKERNTIFVCNLDSGKMVEFHDQSLDQPKGVSHYISDMYFICSCGTDSVVQFLSSGRVLAVNKIDMRQPSTVCVSPHRNRLLVSNCMKGHKKLALFNIH